MCNCIKVTVETWYQQLSVNENKCFLSKGFFKSYFHCKSQAASVLIRSSVSCRKMALGNSEILFDAAAEKMISFCSSVCLRLHV